MGYFTKWLGALTISAVGSLAGVLLGVAAIYGSSDPVALVSSLAALAAATAAFLTVREMKAARVLSARARIGFAASIQPLEVNWDLSTNLLRFQSGSPSVMLRNSTAGSANEVQALWTAEVKISETDLSNVNSVLPKGNSISVAPNKHEVVFHGPGPNSAFPLSGTARVPLGDVGPAQEFEVQVPSVIATYATLKWLTLFNGALSGSALAPDEAPRFSLKIYHRSMYEDEIIDEHHLRFTVANFRVDGEDGIRMRAGGLIASQLIEFTIIPELWSSPPKNEKIIVV